MLENLSNKKLFHSKLIICIKRTLNVDTNDLSISIYSVRNQHNYTVNVTICTSVCVYVHFGIWFIRYINGLDFMFV